MNFIFNILSGRSDQIESSLKVFNDTGIILLKYNEQMDIYPVEGINLGLVYLSTILHSLFEINTTQTINIFFGFYLLSCFLLIFFLVKKLTLNIKKKVLIFFYIYLVFFLIYIKVISFSSEYILYFFPPILSILYSSYYFNKENSKLKIFVGFFIFILFFLGETIKSYSSISGYVIFFFLILFKEKNFLNKLFINILFFFLLSINFVQAEYSKNIQIQNYKKLKNQDITIDHLATAPKWITIYTGLSFVNNPYIKEWDDNYVASKLKKLNPNYLILNSIDNEIIAKNEVLKIFKKDKGFIFRLTAAKIGVILIWFLIFANVGFFYFFYKKIEYEKKLSIFLSIIFSSIFPLLAIPVTAYMFGLVGSSVGLWILYISNKNINLKKDLKNILFFFIKKS